MMTASTMKIEMSMRSMMRPAALTRIDQRVDSEGAGIINSADPSWPTGSVSSFVIDLDRVTRPLGALLRLAFAGVVVAAMAVDVWIMNRYGDRSSALPVLAVGALGIGWARWPRAIAPVALAAAAFSFVATDDLTTNGLRFALFTEYLVLPVMFGALLHGFRWYRILIAAAVAVAAELVSTRADDRAITYVMALAMLVLLGAATAAVVYIRVRDSERRTSIERARQNERLELARELHDVVGHHVTGIVVLAQARRFTAAAAAGSVADPEHDATLAEIERAGLETMTSIRRLVGLLRADPTTSSGPQLADIELMVDELHRSHPLTTLAVDDQIRSRWVPADLAATVQRLAHEITTNVRKHGDPAQPVTLSLRRTDHAVEFRAANASLRTTHGNGFGLVGMRERVEAFGGSFVAGVDGSGMWVVRCVLPLTVAVRP